MQASIARALRVGTSVACAIALCSGYVIADIAGALPAPLPHVLQFAEVQSMSQLHVGSVHTPTNNDNALDRTQRHAQEHSSLKPLVQSIDAAAATQRIAALTHTEGIGSVSAIIADAQGTTIAASAPTTQREPASTLKTLTALAASQVLDMGATLDTALWIDTSRSSGSTAMLVLTGQGDMLLSAGTNDTAHVNGRAGLASLTAQAAQVLHARGISTVQLEYDDTLFGAERIAPAVDTMQDGRLYAAPLSSMAIDQGKNWTGLTRPSDPDAEGAYAPGEDHSALRVAQTVQSQLQQQGVTVQGTPQARSQAFTATQRSEQISVIHSAPLAQLLAFTLQNSDNTEAELFGRLTALATGHANSIAGDVQAVTEQVERAGISLAGCYLADTSGLSAGSHISAQTLIQVQAHALAGSSASVVARALAVSGYNGTIGTRDLGSSVNGQIYAKTGTLNTVSSLTGYVLRNNGGTLTFAVIVNNPDDISAAIAAINTFVSGLPQL